MRRRTPAADAATMPEHLRRYREPDWNPGALTEAGLLDPPEDWPFGAIRWHQIHARVLWREAGKAWLSEHGHDPAGHFRATRPTPGVDYEPIG